MILKINLHIIGRKITLGFLLLLLSGNLIYLEAQNNVIFTVEDKQIDVGDDALIYIDKSASLSINDIKKVHNKNNFKLKLKDIPSYSKSAIWLVINVENKLNKDLFLEFKPELINQISVFTVSKGVVTDSVTVGRVFAYDDREVKTKNFVFSVNSGLYTYYIRVKSDTYLPFTLKLIQKKEFYKNEHFGNLVNGILFGTLILTFLYNLLLFLSVRDRIYLYYVLLVLFSALTLSFHFGVSNHVSGILYPIFSKHITILYSVVNICYVLFVIKVLDLSESYPIFYKIFRAILILVLIVIVIDILGYTFESNILLIIVFGIFYFFIFILSVFLVKRNDISTILFSLSWMFSVVAFIIFILQNLHVFSNINGVFQSLVYGAYLNLITLSLVMGNKLNIYSLNEQRAKYKELVALKDRDDVIRSQNLKLEELVRERNKEIIGKNNELFYQQSEIENQINEIKQKNIQIKKINEELQLQNLKIEEQNVYLTENRHKLEKTVKLRTDEFEVEKKRAITADRLKTSFLNNLSREIKTPMNAITGYASLILNSTISRIQRDEYLRIIIKNVDALLSLIDDVVILSRIQAGIVNLKIRDVDLESFFTLIVDEFNQKIRDSKNNNVKIVLDLPEKLNSISIKSDYNKLWLIFSQLMDNSLKYTSKGQVTIGCYIKECENVKEQKLQENQTKFLEIDFFVKDTGRGMSEKDIDKYIIRYQTTDFDYSYRKGGLGLAIVAGLVKVFNGTLKVNSELEKGTDFSFSMCAELI